jgi:hypothetical protein
VFVEPTSETWVPHFNFAPAQRVAASLPPGQATPSSILSRAAGVYFVRSEQDITAVWCRSSRFSPLFLLAACFRALHSGGAI